MNIENDPEVIDSVIIHDDIILYISDTLKWIPRRNPALHKTPVGAGINYHGVTLFNQNSAVTLKIIFTAWRDLILNSPLVKSIPQVMMQRSLVYYFGLSQQMQGIAYQHLGDYEQAKSIYRYVELGWLEDLGTDGQEITREFRNFIWEN